jgi:hypothetical protein
MSPIQITNDKISQDYETYKESHKSNPGETVWDYERRMKREFVDAALNEIRDNIVGFKCEVSFGIFMNLFIWMRTH